MASRFHSSALAPGIPSLTPPALRMASFVDGLDNPGLNGVTIAGFTVKNALYEGVLVVNTSDVTIRNNQVVNNDKIGPVFGSGPWAAQANPAYENDESGDCGGGFT